MPSAQVTVTDSAGKALALGELDLGKPGGEVKSADGEIEDAATKCTFAFEVEAVPEGEGIYGIEVARRGAVRFQRDQLNAPVELTLGG